MLGLRGGELEHWDEISRKLFVPFRDATSGKESYGAARYLDLEDEPSGEYVLDFNLAYNPYCAYSDDYVCPFPPKENWLTAPVRAGEKAFPLHCPPAGTPPGELRPASKVNLKPG